jgi:mannose-6-phosphate isomerase-like protein (cupin superfamily)
LVSSRSSTYTVLIAVFLAAGAIQGAENVQTWTTSELKNSSGQLAAEAEAKSITGKTLGTYGNHSASLWRRAKSGQAELHRTKTDLLIVQQGSATLVFGGTIQAPRATAPNEVRGTSIRGGESKKIEAGDIIRIPAGTPHQFLLEKGQSIAYFALKISR